MKKVLVFCTLFVVYSAHALDVSESWVDFGEIEVGDSDSLSVEVTNDTDKPVEVSVDDSADFVFYISHDCDGILSPGSSCDIDIDFDPDESGSFSGEITVETDDDSESIELEGEGYLEEED
jgi:hypothetical protein